MRLVSAERRAPVSELRNCKSVSCAFKDGDGLNPQLVRPREAGAYEGLKQDLLYMPVPFTVWIVMQHNWRDAGPLSCGADPGLWAKSRRRLFPMVPFAPPPPG